MARPLKSSVILNKMTLAFDPQSKAPLAFAGHIPDLNEVLPSGVPEKASDLLRKLADLADKVFDETSKEGNSCSDTKAELEKLRNLAWGDSPEKAIILAEKMSFVGERTKSCLLKHLAEQDILLRELRAIAQIARRRILDELSEINPSMVDFTNKLVAAGIVQTDVRFLSSDKLAAIVSIIKGTDNDDNNGGIPPFLSKMDALRKPPINRVLDESAIEASFRRSGEDPESVENQALEQGDGSSSPKSAETAVDGLFDGRVQVKSDAVPDSELRSNSASGLSDLPAVSDRDKMISGSNMKSVRTEKSSSDQLLKHGNESQILSSGRTDLISSMSDELPFSRDRNGQDRPIFDSRMPHGFSPGRPVENAAPYDWNDMDMISMGYMFDGVVASTDADMEALKIVLPTERRLPDLVDPQAQAGLYALARSAFETANRADFDRFMDQYLATKNRHMSEMERRIWALLLVDYPNRSSLLKLNPHGYYHGVVLPGQHGTAKVRRIILLKRDPDFLEHAFKF